MVSFTLSGYLDALTANGQLRLPGMYKQDLFTKALVANDFLESFLEGNAKLRGTIWFATSV